MVALLRPGPKGMGRNGLSFSGSHSAPHPETEASEMEVMVADQAEASSQLVL
jgi:hypothetical protein